jgi:hypothetical protein
MTEEIVHLARARHFFPGVPSRSTVYRWIREGICHNGEQVFLEGMMVGGRMFVKRSEADRFLKRLNTIRH